MADPARPFRVCSIRPLVRYVDDEQAVIEVRVGVGDGADPGLVAGIELEPPRGATFRARAPLDIDGDEAVGRVDLPEPARWWPAGMGEQALYRMTVTVEQDEKPVACRQTLIGLTSVRRPDGARRFESLLVNGRERPIREVVPVEPDDESGLLAAGGRSLLVIRHHFGPERLYEAADMAGLLLVQSIPADRLDDPDIHREISRLTCHPSLAGWLLEPIDRVATALVEKLRRLDPTHQVMG